ncbi:MAG: GTPase [archaeon]|nr:GTPase [archaeon]
MGFWVIVDNVISKVDIVLLIVDARMPELSKNSKLKYLIDKSKRRLVIVFTKSDLVSRVDIGELKRKYPYAFLVSGVKNIGVNRLKRSLLIMGKRMGLKNPRIGVVGYPNVGKSALINAMAKRARAKVSPRAGTTRGVQWVNAGSLVILDSPGVVPYEDSEFKLGFIGSKDPEKIENKEKVACGIIDFILQKNKKILEDYYGASFDGDSYDILLAIGKRRGFLMKGGKVDEVRTAIQIIRDWQQGRLRV